MEDKSFSDIAKDLEKEYKELEKRAEKLLTNKEEQKNRKKK